MATSDVHAKINILSLDGGGIRGLFELEILKHLDQAIKEAGGDKDKSIVDYFDLIAGTSTGGIIALALGLAGKSIDEVIALYRSLASEIFAGKDSWIDHFKSWIQAGWDGYNGFTKGYYNTNKLEDLLKKNFSEHDKMFVHGKKDRKVFVVATRSDKSQFEPYLIRSYPRVAQTGSTAHKTDWASGTDKDTHWTLWQAARATSAAPTYFDEFSIVDEKKIETKFVDGGLIANNPTELALYESSQLWGETDRTLGLVLSLGCGTAHAKYDQAPSIFAFKNKVQDLLTESRLTDHAVQRHRQTVKFWCKAKPYAYVRMDPPEGAQYALSSLEIDAIIKLVDDWMQTSEFIHLKNQVIDELKEQGLIVSPTSSSH